MRPSAIGVTSYVGIDKSVEVPSAQTRTRRVVGVRYAIVVLVGIVAVPIGILGGIIAVAAIAGELFGFRLVDLSGVPLLGWFSNLPFIDFLYGGPAAGPNSFENYVTGFVGFMIAAIAFVPMFALWQWASEPSRNAESESQLR